MAGTDIIKFSAHSTHTASTSAAFIHDVTIDTVLSQQDGLVSK